jgi:hypothetical protein
MPQGEKGSCTAEHAPDVDPDRILLGQTNLLDLALDAAADKRLALN